VAVVAAVAFLPPLAAGVVLVTFSCSSFCCFIFSHSCFTPLSSFIRDSCTHQARVRSLVWSALPMLTPQRRKEEDEVVVMVVVVVDMCTICMRLSSSR